MEYQDETVFVNYEKLDQRQNRQSRDGRREPAESRQDCPAPGELDQAYMKLGKAYYEGGFEEPLPELLPLFDQITRFGRPENRQRNHSFAQIADRRWKRVLFFAGNVDNDLNSR